MGAGNVHRLFLCGLKRIVRRTKFNRKLQRKPAKLAYPIFTLKLVMRTLRLLLLRLLTPFFRCLYQISEVRKKTVTVKDGRITTHTTAGRLSSFAWVRSDEVIPS